jgi:hypothetical protein
MNKHQHRFTGWFVKDEVYRGGFAVIELLYLRVFQSSIESSDADSSRSVDRETLRIK